jgi:hypothetical protein
LHAGACIAPRSAGRYKRSFWKLAALDRQLGAFETGPTSFSSPPTFASNFLRAVATAPAPPAAAAAGLIAVPACPATVLCLATRDSSAAEYVALCHASGEHTLQLGRLFCFETPGLADLERVLPGFIKRLTPGISTPQRGAHESERLAFFSVVTSDAVAAQAGKVDVVIGVPLQTLRQ